MSFSGAGKLATRQYNQVLTIALDGGNVSFSLVDMPIPTGRTARPLLKNQTYIPTKLDVKGGRTRPEKATFNLQDDGGYLRRLFADLYYYGRAATLEEGFEHNGAFHARTVMKLMVSNYSVFGDVFKVECKSRTVVLDESVPPQEAPIVPIVYTNAHPVTIMRDLLINQGINALVEGDLRSARWDEIRDEWLQGWAFSRTISKPIKKLKLLEELQRLTQTAIFEDEDGLLSLGYVHPPRPHVDFKALTDDDLMEAVDFDDEQDNLLTRVNVYYDYDGTGGENDSASYASFTQAVDADLESATKFGVSKPYNVFSQWDMSATRAQAVANRILLRQRGTPDSVKLALDIKDADLSVDEVFDLTTKDITNSVGTKKQRRYHAISRKISEKLIDVEALDTQFAVDNRYGFIAHTGAADYAMATVVEKQHCYIGDATGKVNSGTENGYRIF